MKRIILSTAVLASLTFAGGDVIPMEHIGNNNAIMAEIEALKGEVAALKAKKPEKSEKTDDKLAKKIKAMNKKINKVRAHDANDNIKFSLDFRNTLDNIEYTYNDYPAKPDETGAKNNALLTSRLLLNMKSAPTKNLSFQGQLAVYSNWGTHLFEEDKSLKSWSASSKSGDTIMRLKEAYFVYKNKALEGKLPYAFSIGRRPASDGFLANHRENEKKPASPLAHITNMEVDAAMVKIVTQKYLLPGSFLKLIYGRAHAGGMESVYDAGGTGPYAQADGDANENVDFFVALGSLYNNGQYNLMGQHTVVFNTKGANDAPLSATNKSLDAGTAQLSALSLEVDGVGDEINDFLDDTVLFASVAQTIYQPNSGKQLLGSTEDETGHSVWVGATIPDMITDNGRFGVEFNKGSQYWTPMTWAEDSAIGSKIAVRGEAYEAYWNFNLFGEKNLPSQIRYTHAQHDYTPNIRCSGWVEPKALDLESDDIRLSVSYRY